MSESNRTSRRLALAGIAGPIAWWLLVILNGAITPGYSHVGNYISTLGAVGASYAFVQVINFAVLGGAILSLMLGVHRWFGDGRRPRFGTVLLGIFGVGVILAGIFPENSAAPQSLSHVLHNIVSIIAFVTGIGGIALVSRRTGGDSRWPSYRFESAGTTVIVIGTFVVFIFSVLSNSAFVGLTQRLFIGVMTLWVMVQSLRLYRLVEPLDHSEVGENRSESTEGRVAD